VNIVNVVNVYRAPQRNRLSCSATHLLEAGAASPSPTIAWSHWRTTRLLFAGVTLPTTIGRK
jgi:hypothetical protein